MKDPIQDVIRQTRRYWYVDGLTELSTGVLLVALGMVYAMLGWIGPNQTVDRLSSVGLIFFILLGALLGRRVVSALKERLTYPRTGYVANTATRAGQKVWSILFGICAALVLALLAAHFNIPWLVYVAPAVMAAALIAFIGMRYGLRRFFLLALYTLLLGIPMAVLRLDDQFNLALFWLLCGAGWIVSGGLTLRGYLQNTQSPLGESE